MREWNNIILNFYINYYQHKDSFKIIPYVQEKFFQNEKCVLVRNGLYRKFNLKIFK